MPGTIGPEMAPIRRQPCTSSPDRRAERPASHLKGFRGVLQVDGYAGLERLTANGEVTLAACWAHARRKYYEVHAATGSPVAAEALRRVAELYEIEARIRGQASEKRRAVRRREARPLVAAMSVHWRDAYGTKPSSAHLKLFEPVQAGDIGAGAWDPRSSGNDRRPSFRSPRRPYQSWRQSPW